MIDLDISEWNYVANHLSFAIPGTYQESISNLLASAETLGHQFSVRIKLPMRKRSTGYRSANSRFHGHCANIAEQIINADGSPIYTADEIKAAMKRMAVGDGYQTHLTLDGTEQPKPTRDCSVEEMYLLQQVLQRYADIHDLWLIEYDENEQPYKSKGGRSREEM